jgi:hypothetical protein
MKYAIEMGSGAMTCISNFINIGWGIQELMGRGGGHTHMDTQTARWSYKPTFISSK